FAEREEAERILLHKDLAVPHIKLASVRNATPEVRARCTRILEKRRADAREDVSRELNEMVHRGEFARAIGVALVWRDALGEKLGDFERSAAKCLSEVVQKKTNRPTTVPKFPNPDFAKEFQILLGSTDEVIIRSPRPINWLIATNRIKLASNAMSCAFLVSD